MFNSLTFRLGLLDFLHSFSPTLAYTEFGKVSPPCTVVRTGCVKYRQTHQCQLTVALQLLTLNDMKHCIRCIINWQNIP